MSEFIIIYSCLFSSGYDGTVRVWNLPNRTHQFLQQTCVFNKGENMSGEELDGQPLCNVIWNATGKLLAASMEHLINIWATSGWWLFT
jgi:E3 ubiquitin-protein ligase HERC1